MYGLNTILSTKKVVILGGGIAGLSAASFLSEKGFKTELIESSPKLGGRAYSFFDKDSGLIFDNGQHIMMGCYKETLKFLSLINASDNIDVQKELEVRFLAPGFKEYILKSSGAFYPFNLLSGLLRFEALTLWERFSLLRVFAKLWLYSEKDLRKRTVLQWLKEENQSSNSIKAFWEIICIGALNADIETASAYLFVHVMKEIFLKGNNNSKILLPALGLSEMYCNDAERFIMEKGGEIYFNETVEKISFNKNKVTSIKTDQRTLDDFDYVISALPYYSLKKILPGIKDIPFEYSPILSAQVVLKENKLENKFYGLIDSPVHWIFNKGTHISIVISSAADLVKMGNEELCKMITTELIEYIGIKKDDITSVKIIKEKRATFIPSNKVLSERPSTNTLVPNFFIAGDWVQTNLPATIEGAVLSSRMAADQIMC